PGVESRAAFFAAYKYRIKGFAYYAVTDWGSDPYQNPRPAGTAMNGDGFLLYPPKNGDLVSSIRWELLREGEEDFEYLLKLAGGVLPKTPDEATGCDASAASAASAEGRPPRRRRSHVDEDRLDAVRPEGRLRLGGAEHRQVEHHAVHVPRRRPGQRPPE